MARGISPCHALDGDHTPLGDQSAHQGRTPADGRRLRQAVGATKPKKRQPVERALPRQPWPPVRPGLRAPKIQGSVRQGLRYGPRERGSDGCEEIDDFEF